MSHEPQAEAASPARETTPPEPTAAPLDHAKVSGRVKAAPATKKVTK